MMVIVAANATWRQTVPQLPAVTTAPHRHGSARFPERDLRRPLWTKGSRINGANDE